MNDVHALVDTLVAGKIKFGANRKQSLSLLHLNRTQCKVLKKNAQMNIFALSRSGVIGSVYEN